MDWQVTLSPSLRSTLTTRRLMLEVAAALLPAGVIGVLRFGFSALLLIAVSVGACVAFEALFQTALKKTLSISDGSALVSGLLLAYNLPPSAPVWMPVAGAAFAMIIVKGLFGGLGRNFVNPVLAARAFLLASWPVAMTSFPLPGVTDAIASATPLAGLLTPGAAIPSVLDLLLGATGGCIGEVGRAGILLGGLYLIARRVVDWRIPLGFLGGSALLSLLAGWLNPAWAGAPLTDPVFYLLSGGLMLGAFFMATDYVTSPATRWGRAVFGLGCAVIVFVIRAYGGYPEGVTYAILLMNISAPLIERATMPRVYGHKRRVVKTP